MKKFSALLLAAALCFSAAGCGSKPSAESVSASGTAEPLPISSVPANSAGSEAVPAIDLVGYYEQPNTDEYGMYASLLLRGDRTGIFFLQDLEGEIWDETTLEWGDGRFAMGYGYTGDYAFSPEPGLLALHFDSEFADAIDDMEFLRMQKAPEAGSYCAAYTDELNGEPYEFKAWILLAHDHTGYIAIQDIFEIRWENGEIFTLDGDKVCGYVLTGEGDLQVLWDGGAEETYPRTFDLPDFLLPGSEYTPDDMVGTWVVEDIFTEEDDGSVTSLDLDEYGIFSYLDIDINEAGDLCGFYHYESNGGFIEVPFVDMEYADGPANPYFYNQCWHMILSGTGTVNDNDRDPRPYEIMPPEVPGSELQWVEMTLSMNGDDQMTLELCDRSDGLYDPITSRFYLIRSMG